MKLLIDYEQLATNAASAMRRVTQMLTRAGLQLVDVASDGKARRIAGVSFREVVLTFVDSQSLTLRVKATGDVYEVRLNGKVVPMREQNDPVKAVGELVKMLDANRERHQKRLAALQMKPPAGARTAAPKLKEALKAQIAEVDAAIGAAREELAAIEAA